MKLKCIIVDDEPVARKLLREFTEEIEWLELVGEGENPLRAIPMLENNTIDLIFLDINMPKISGLDFLKSSKLESSVVITTAYPMHAVEAYGLDVIDYLVKPIPFERFLKACNKVKDLKIKKESPNPVVQDHFFVKCDFQIEKVLYDELLYAEAMMNYVYLYTEKRKMMVYVTFKGLMEQLPGDRFIKVHKSFIVNISKIKSIDGNMLNIGNAKITISQGLREQVIHEIVKDKLIRR